MHVVVFGLYVWFGGREGFGPIWYGGLVLTAVAFVYQHAIVSPTDLSRSPSATLTGATFGSTLDAGTDGSSVEDMRQCYETITQGPLCSPSQTAGASHGVRIGCLLGS